MDYSQSSPVCTNLWTNQKSKGKEIYVKGPFSLKADTHRSKYSVDLKQPEFTTGDFSLTGVGLEWVDSY